MWLKTLAPYLRRGRPWRRYVKSPGLDFRLSSLVALSKKTQGAASFVYFWRNSSDLTATNADQTTAFSTGDDEDDDDSDDDPEFVAADEKFHRTRLVGLRTLRDAGIQVYPHKFNAELSVEEFRRRFDHLQPGERAVDDPTSIAGRIMSRREHGKNLSFYDLQSGEANLQLLLNAKEFNDPAQFLHFVSFLHRGDVVGCCGVPCRTRSGELTLLVRDLKILAPCLRLVPQMYTGLWDVGQRARNRHLDLLLNASTRETFAARATMTATLRSFLETRGFLEVETPLMHTVAGGAAARPFVTRHHHLGVDVFLRVAPELHLKRLVVGGLDRVFEIGRQFRNEGVDRNHHPEFTMLELYAAFSDYEDLMSLTEEMLAAAAAAVNDGSTALRRLQQRRRREEEELVEEEAIDLAPPFRRISMMEELERRTGVRIDPSTLDRQPTLDVLFDLCQRHEVPIQASPPLIDSPHPPPPPSATRLIDRLFKRLVEPTLQSPTFVVDHPLVASPLAKPHRSKEGVAERFELFIGGREIVNGYTESNDPAVQREAFGAQTRRRVGDDDDDVMPADEEYCRVLDYGLPPTAGLGIGLDRLAMLLTGADNIREVLLFPVRRKIAY